MLKKLFLTLALAAAIGHVHPTPTLDMDLVSKLSQGPVTILIRMKERTTATLSTVSLQSFATRSDRLNAVAKALKDFTSESQRPVLDFLAEEQATKSFELDPLWVSNIIIVRNVDLDTVLKLSEFSEIESIKAEESYPLDPPIDLHEFTPEELAGLDEGDIQWGVARIHAPECWKTGNRGEGIVIATVDTGARGTHEALASNFFGDYGWFDPGRATLEPNDGNGHGTHTTATIAGTVRNVGVAPASKWAACKGCASSFCLQGDLLKCGQFFVCPTLADGTSPDCTKAPHLVSNSWGGGRGNEWYKETVAAYRAAGIVPLFSQGNSGPACGTANSPGDYDNLIGVGSTTETRELSYFSSVGPTSIGARIKPDVAAPGSNVFSAYHTSDTAYASMSGTSMACPHAAGAVALILSEFPEFDYDLVKYTLEQGSLDTIQDTGANCGNVSETVYPNHMVGYGRVDAEQSLIIGRRLTGKKLH